VKTSAIETKFRRSVASGRTLLAISWLLVVLSPACSHFDRTRECHAVAALINPELDVIDVKQGVVSSSINVGPRLRGVAFLPDGSRAYVAAEQDGEVAVLDAARRTIVARVKTAIAPSGVTAHPDGKRVFVNAANEGKVQVLDTGTNSIVAGFDVCNAPSSMTFTPEGHKLYVTCGAADQVWVFDTSTYSRLARVPVGIKPLKAVVSEPPPPLDGDFPPRRGRSRAPS
jgi:YVTN family beta-propeller protein